jgi:hypothetical protein
MVGGEREGWFVSGDDTAFGWQLDVLLFSPDS